MSVLALCLTHPDYETEQRVNSKSVLRLLRLTHSVHVTDLRMNRMSIIALWPTHAVYETEQKVNSASS